LIIVTLRRGGSFDPVQFFRDVLIRINPISANLVKDDQYWADDGGKPSIMPIFILSERDEISCFGER
jgi:hypothetical protein